MAWTELTFDSLKYYMAWLIIVIQQSVSLLHWIMNVDIQYHYRLLQSGGHTSTFLLRFGWVFLLCPEVPTIWIHRLLVCMHTSLGLQYSEISTCKNIDKIIPILPILSGTFASKSYGPSLYCTPNIPQLLLGIPWYWKVDWK